MLTWSPDKDENIVLRILCSAESTFDFREESKKSQRKKRLHLFVAQNTSYQVLKKKTQNRFLLDIHTFSICLGSKRTKQKEQVYKVVCGLSGG